MILRLKLFLIHVAYVMAQSDCNVSIPFYVERKCPYPKQVYENVEITVYIDVLYLVPMDDACSKCVVVINPECIKSMEWSLDSQCIQYTVQQCESECQKTHNRLKNIIDTAPLYPPPPRLQRPTESSTRQRIRNHHHQHKCITKEKEKSHFVLRDCDNSLEQQFYLFSVKDGEYVIMHSPKKDQTQCQKRRNTDYWECNVPGCMISQCDEDGSFHPRQCHLSIGYTGTCWCVDGEGNEVNGTRTDPGSDPPQCSEVQSKSEVSKKPKKSHGPARRLLNHHQKSGKKKKKNQKNRMKKKKITHKKSCKKTGI